MAISIAENILKVTERVRKAARKAGRDPSEVTIVAASKAVEPRKIREAVANGICVFGENYVQEATEKIEKIRDKSIRWHLIGNLQKNKAKFAVEFFDCIHTVDSIDLAKELDKRASEPVDVLIQVNISREKTKAGVDADGCLKLAKAVSALPKLRLKGLMTMPPFFEDPEMSRPYFVTLRRLAEHINKERLPGVWMRELSMGMSHDFETAIEEGATMIRIGTAIFGLRPEKAGKAKK